MQEEKKWIDLRSDTVTQPTQQMREAMYHAQVGDDVYGDDPTMKELEEKARIIAGQTLKEALHGITLDELSIGQEVLKKVFYNTKD